MTKLISTYAAATGLKVDKPNVKETFYPLPFTRYITIQTGSGQGAKNYDYFQEVIVWLKPVLDRHGIAVVHLGGKDDPQLAGVYDLRGKTSVIQSHYLIRRGILHLGNDSWLAHCKGWTYGPLISLYGSTSEQNHSPYWFDKEKTSFLSSHRGGGVPTYIQQEQPKTINTIPPEQICNEVIRLLALPSETLFTHQTRLFGLVYTNTMFEVIPDSFPGPDFMPGAPMTVRMDQHFDENVLLNLLRTGRKVHIITNREIKLEVLAQFRASIIGYTHEIDASCGLTYPTALKSVVPNSLFYTKEKDDKKVADLRYQFFDLCTIERVNDLTRDDYLSAALGYLNWAPERKADLESELAQTDTKLRFKSNKLILSDGKVHLSLAHWKAKQSVESIAHNTAAVIDSPDFWRELNHLTIYYQP